MHKISFSLILFLMTVLPGYCLELGEEAVLSLLTCSPGDVNYNAYGHSAIRVRDAANGLDLVYNYGTFDNDIENFEMKFARGTVQYSLEIESFRNFYYNYDYFGRSIYEQTLDLTQQQKQELFDFLNENAKPENKYYWYDFIFNNCSSVIRDVISEVSGVEFPEECSRQSFRDMIDHYNQNSEWNDFGIDILLGAKIDRCARMDETMFLPDHLMSEFGKATIGGRPLVSRTETILDHGYGFYTEKGWMNKIGPAAVLWIVLAVLFLVKLYAPGGLPPVFSVLFLTILGLAGWFLLFMWFGTRHDATKWNLNILWAFPLNFPMAFFLFRKEMKRWMVRYFHIVRVILVSLIFLWPVFPQRFHIAILPLILIALLAISSNIPAELPQRAVKST
jgi:hypothetical protein